MKKTTVAMFVCLMLIGSTRASAAPDRARGVTLGQAAPDFAYPDRYGNLVSLRDFAGKKIVLFFWVSWCVCRDQLPLLQKYRDANQGKNFEIVSISIDAQGKRYADPIVALAGVKYPALLDRRADSARLFHYPASPSAFLIDEAGVVKHQYISEFDMGNEKTRREVDAFLAEKPVPAPKAAKTDAKKTLAALEKQALDTPNAAGARRRLAGFLMDSGDIAAALTHWEALVKQNKRSCEDIFSLGTVNYYLDKKEEALKNWKAASRCDSTNYIYFRTVQSFEDPDQFYTKEKMKDLYPGQ